MGLKGLVDASGILVSNATGDPSWSSQFALLSLITLIALIFGGLFIGVFFIPSRNVVVDAAAQAVHVSYRYPFGFRRNNVFALHDIKPPEIAWRKDTDSSDGGRWELKLTLPDGRSITRSSDSPNLTMQKQQAEDWKAKILAVRR